jgi:hypothetical protein
MKSLISFAELLQIVPVKDTAMRQYLKAKGFTRPEGRKNLLFTPQDVERIKEDFTCRLSLSPLGSERTNSGMSGARSVDKTLKRLQAQRTKTMLKDLRMSLKAAS